MDKLPYLIWGVACLLAVVGTYWVFNEEAKQDRLIIESQRKTIRHLRTDLEREQASHRRTRSRLSELMPVDEALDRIVAHEQARARRDTPFDQNNP
jgi:hypothetical protein